MTSTLSEDTASFLRANNVNPTAQRVSITRVLFDQKSHLSADDVYQRVKAEGAHVSKATVYNTLGLLAEKGVIREVIVDPNRVVYDPNVSPHHHFYDQDTGQLTDIDAGSVEVTGLPPLPEGTSLEGIDVIVRLKRAR